ncbi:MAG: hypothetical protein AB7I59_19160 [Geminicoccaceae bacterium]
MPGDRRDGGGGLDEISRLQVVMAARLLRSIVPSDGEIEISLHEIARRLEQIAEAGAQAAGHSPVRM